MDNELGIDLTKLEAGTMIFAETESDQLFEIKIVHPEKGVVEISGTEPRLKMPVLGILTHSSSGKVQINHWIGTLLKMSLVFKNGNFESTPVIHASVKSPKWNYNVF